MKNKNKKFDPYDNPIWIQYQCDNGAQWTAVKGGMCEHNMDEPCGFSGCQGIHRVNIISETNNGHVAHEWFKRPPEGREQNVD